MAGFSISNLAPREGKEKSRLTISLNHDTEKIRIWDDSDKYVEIDFADVPYVICQIKDPSTPRDRQYFEKMISAHNKSTPPTQP